MITYKAMYKAVDGGVHAEVLDFPGAITCGAALDHARRMLADALADMAEAQRLQSKPLPAPDPSASSPDADLEEPIHLLITAATRVSVVPDGAAP